MRRRFLSRVLRAAKRDRWLLVQVGLLQLAVRFLLPAIGLKRTRKIVVRTGGFLRGTSMTEPARIVRIVEVVGLKLRSTCLMNAVSAQAVLAAHGHSSRLRLGVARDAGAFGAHAWLEADDRILIGGPAAVVGKYAAFPDLDSLAI